MAKIPSGFHQTDWDAKIDVGSYLSSVPESATIKGVFPASILERLNKNDLPHIGPDEYHSFGDYSMRDHMVFLVDAAEKLYPGVSLGRGLRSLGHLAYDSFLDSLVGRVLLGVLGKKVGSILRVSPKAWSAAVSHGGISVDEVSSQEAFLQANDLHYFMDFYCVGIAEGMLIACESRGVVALNAGSPQDARVFIAWE